MPERGTDDRLDAILGMLESIASLDFSQQLPVGDHADRIDAVASGLNMLSEELQARVVDISELRAAELESTRVADDLARLIDTANAPIFGIDVDGRLNEWNQKAASITGYEAAEVMGTTFVEGSI
ncbi:MAG: PAS domain-containing protein, partial [Gemmatimonadetes bacterium]|nr:PAS domain-containing protein [Gemmatimonadota bacterium]